MSFLYYFISANYFFLLLGADAAFAICFSFHFTQIVGARQIDEYAPKISPAESGIAKVRSEVRPMISETMMITTIAASVVIVVITVLVRVSLFDLSTASASESFAP